MMKEILRELKDKFPITWDRYVKHVDDKVNYTVFGWIARCDGQRDFVAIWFDEGQKLEEAGFMTSSAKYSKAIADLLNSDHTDCTALPEELR